MPSQVSPVDYLVLLCLLGFVAAIGFFLESPYILALVIDVMFGILCVAAVTFRRTTRPAVVNRLPRNSLEWGFLVAIVVLLNAIAFIPASQSR